MCAYKLSANHLQLYRNIWAPEEQKASIRVSFLDTYNNDIWLVYMIDKPQTITNHYGISERLQGMMCTDLIRSSLPESNTSPTAMHSHSPLQSPRADDIEQQQEFVLDDKLECHQKENRRVSSVDDLTFAFIPEQLWHFCSVDYGQRCEYTIYNI